MEMKLMRPGTNGVKAHSGLASSFSGEPCFLRGQSISTSRSMSTIKYIIHVIYRLYFIYSDVTIHANAFYRFNFNET
jgi:hypothetical protein